MKTSIKFYLFGVLLTTSLSVSAGSVLDTADEIQSQYPALSRVLIIDAVSAYLLSSMPINVEVIDSGIDHEHPQINVDLNSPGQDIDRRAIGTYNAGVVSRGTDIATARVAAAVVGVMDSGINSGQHPQLNIDLTPPGQDIDRRAIGTYNAGVVSRGTDIATARVAAAVSILKQKYPSLSPKTLKGIFLILEKH